MTVVQIGIFIMPRTHVINSCRKATGDYTPHDNIMYILEQHYTYTSYAHTLSILIILKTSYINPNIK